MSDYIKREEVILALLEKGQHSKRYKLGESWELNLEEIREAISEVPAADVAPVRHGKWILEYEPNGKPYCFHCSVCDEDFHCISITTAYPFCPNCGATMEDATDV